MSFFASIRNPQEARRALLESSKYLLECLKASEKEWVDLRSEKAKTLEEFKKTFDEIAFLLRKLRGKLPKGLHFPKIIRKAPSPKKIVSVAPKIEAKAIEEELAQIEAKLAELERAK